MSTVNEILEERQKTHGDYVNVVTYSQSLKNVVRNTAAYTDMSYDKREALDMLCHKIARVLAGNPNFKDHWDDMAGYATLVSKRL